MLNQIAAGLAALTATAHIVIGSNSTLRPMLAADLPAAAETPLLAVWHVASIFLVWSVVAFWQAGPTARYFAGIWVFAAATFGYVGFEQGGVDGLLAHPQWAILLFVGFLALAIPNNATGNAEGAAAGHGRKPDQPTGAAERT